MMPSNDIAFWLLLAAAYILGAVPWGVVFYRLFTGKDIRSQGSGNIGATNVGRTAGALPGLLTLFADVAKGALPVWLAVFLTGQNHAGGGLFIGFVALATVMGHLFPCFLKFKGGKGVATAAGCFLVISPAAFLGAAAVFIIGVFLSKRVSVGSLSGAAALPALIWWLGRPPVLSAFAAVIAVLIWIRHQENIRRILSGREPPFRMKKSGKRP